MNINTEKESLLNIDVLMSELEYKSDIGEFYWRNSRPGVRKGKRAGSIKVDGYRKVRLKGIEYLEHRLVWFYVNKVWPETLDHIDRNKINNRIVNLRECNTRDNSYNRPDNSEFGHNIYKLRNTNYFTVTLQHNNKTYSYNNKYSLEEATNIRDWLITHLREYNELPNNITILKELLDEDSSSR